MSSIFNYKLNANQKPIQIPCFSSRKATLKKNKVLWGWEKDVLLVDGKLCICNMEVNVDIPKVDYKKNYYMTPLWHCRVIWRISAQRSDSTCTPWLLKQCLQHPKMENQDAVHILEDYLTVKRPKLCCLFEN